MILSGAVTDGSTVPVTAGIDGLVVGGRAVIGRGEPVSAVLVH
jgi:hypothetical protein